MSWTDAVDEISRLDKFIQLCLLGLVIGVEATDQLDVHRTYQETKLNEYRYTSEEEYQKALEDAKNIEQYARIEAANGFSYLYSLAVVKLWGILESMVDDMIFDEFMNAEEYIDDKVISGLKGSLVPFMIASPEEQAEQLVELLKETVNAKKKTGVGYFESILEPIGLSGGVDDDVRRVFVEIKEVRNVLVHRSGVIDKRFLNMCPWLGFSLGQELEIDQNHWEMYILAVHWYIFELDQRMCRKTNTQGVEDIPELKHELLDKLHELIKLRPLGV